MSVSRRELSRRAACPVVPLLPAALSLPKARALTSPRAACPAAAWRRQDVHRVRHPDDRQGGVRPVPLSELPGLRASVSALPLWAGCRGALPARHSAWRRGLASEACARDLRRAAACRVAAVLRPAAVGSASDVRGRPPAVAWLASQVPPRAAPAVPGPAMASRVRPRAVAVWDVQAQPPAEASSGAPQAARAVRERAAAPDAARLPEARGRLCRCSRGRLGPGRRCRRGRLRGCCGRRRSRMCGRRSGRWRLRMRRCGRRCRTCRSTRRARRWPRLRLSVRSGFFLLLRLCDDQRRSLGVRR
ncbi:hypothetical protein AB7M45_002008 [Bradyrhizobium elkanii]